MSFYLKTRYDILLGRPGTLIEVKPEHYLIYGSRRSGKTTYLKDDIRKRPDENKLIFYQSAQNYRDLHHMSKIEGHTYSSMTTFSLRGRTTPDTLYLDDFQDQTINKLWNDFICLFAFTKRIPVTSEYKDEEHFPSNYWHYINLDKGIIK
jgi:hypothetical protein